MAAGLSFTGRFLPQGRRVHVARGRRGWSGLPLWRLPLRRCDLRRNLRWLRAGHDRGLGGSRIWRGTSACSTGLRGGTPAGASGPRREEEVRVRGRVETDAGRV